MTDVCTRGLDTGFIALGYAKVAILGVLQGITELMPISSTAHMRLVPAFLGWTDPGSAFSAAMQLAALAAVVSYFWKDVSTLSLHSFSALSQRRFSDHSLRFIIWVCIATIPIGVAGLALSPVLNACHSPLRRIELIGWACIALAVLLGIAEIMARHRRRMDSATFWDALIVGIAQVGALVPGVSRSGSTLTCALALGFKREEAARFSFLLGLPAIALAGLKELYELHKIHLSAHGWSVLRRRALHGFDLSVFCDLGADANPRTLFELAVRGVSPSARHCHCRRFGQKLAVTGRRPSARPWDTSGLVDPIGTCDDLESALVARLPPANLGGGQLAGVPPIDVRFSVSPMPR